MEQITNNIIASLYDDIVEGASRLYMLRKWLSGAYGNQMTTVEADEEAFAEAYNEAVKYLKLNLEELDDNERDKLYGRYLAVYKAALDNGDLKNARGTLDSMVKLQGLSKSDNKQISVKNDKENDTITISFGLGD